MYKINNPHLISTQKYRLREFYNNYRKRINLPKVSIDGIGEIFPFIVLFIDSKNDAMMMVEGPDENPLYSVAWNFCATDIPPGHLSFFASEGDSLPPTNIDDMPLVFRKCLEKGLVADRCSDDYPVVAEDQGLIGRFYYVYAFNFHNEVNVSIEEDLDIPF